MTFLTPSRALRQMQARGIVQLGQARLSVLDEGLLDAVAAGKLVLGVEVGELGG